MSTAKSPPTTNRLLTSLPKKSYHSLERHFQEVPLVFGSIIYEPAAPISDVYFPNSGIVSLLATANGHSSLEVGMVGNEGMVGLSVFMGVNSSINRAVVQGTGTSLKMKTTTFLRMCSEGGFLPRLLQRYTHSVLAQITQSAVCNQFHAVDARLARWLLMTHDRMGDDEFQLTHDFLSNMLGVRREGVSRAAANLQKRKLIIYSRGKLKVLNRPELEATACPCYQITKTERNSF